MGSPCSHDQWLELSLGLKGRKKKLQEKEEEETKLYCQNTSHEHLDEEINENCLELRLQIGPNRNYNMGLMDLMYHQNKKKQKGAFQSDCYYNYYNSSLTNFRLSSSSPSPNSAGFWFSLLSSPNRKGGAALPQLPKPYIRVKDEKMTVLMVKKYLLTKLGLSNQAQVELWCMGERLLQTQSLKQVRDGIWVPKLVEFLNSNSSLSTSSIFHHCSHLMSLHYGTTSFF